MKDSMEKIKNNLRDFIVSEASRGFDEGAQGVIDILKEAMKVSKLDYIPKIWLDIAQIEIDKMKKK